MATFQKRISPFAFLPLARVERRELGQLYPPHKRYTGCLIWVLPRIQEYFPTKTAASIMVGVEQAQFPKNAMKGKNKKKG